MKIFFVVILATAILSSIPLGAKYALAQNDKCLAECLNPYRDYFDIYGNRYSYDGKLISKPKPTVDKPIVIGESEWFTGK